MEKTKGDLFGPDERMTFSFSPSLFPAASLHSRRFFPSPLKSRKAPATPAASRDIYQTVTDQIVSAMEKGEQAWQMPWHRTGADISRPRNVASRNPYHGINVPALWAAASDKGYQSGWWGSYKQWQEVGGQVRKGEKASPIVFWKKIKKALTDEATGETVIGTFPLARPWSVFNAEQQDGWTEPEPPASENPARVIEHVRQFVESTLAEIRHGGERAYYNRAGDFIQMPPMERFTGTATSTPTEAYYSTELHELTHYAGARIMPSSPINTSCGAARTV